MFDYHVHSTVSFDAYSTMEECARRAVTLGMTEICFTDHHELGYPYKDVKPEFDYDLYFRELDRARAAAPGLVIRAGIEVALIPEMLGEIERDISGREFDFVLASQHVVRGKDPWYGDYFDDKTLRDGQRLYLEEILTDISGFTDFNTIAHIGYVDKYLDKYPRLDEHPRPFQYKDFPELIDDILKVVINRGQGIEVNTSNYYIYGYPTPHPSIIRRFVELGGEVVSIGSDAHSADVIGHEFESAYGLLRECGAKYVCTFEKRKPNFIKI